VFSIFASGIYAAGIVLGSAVNIHFSGFSRSTVCNLGMASFKFFLSCSLGVKPKASSALSESMRPKTAYTITPPPINIRVLGDKLR
jgi:hypothetical protein